MRLIVPHVRRAALIGKVIDQRTAEAATFADTLDGISAAMLLADVKGHIAHANAAGHALLAQANVLHASGGRLVANDPQANQPWPTSLPVPEPATTRLALRASLYQCLRATASTTLHTRSHSHPARGAALV